MACMMVELPQPGNKDLRGPRIFINPRHISAVEIEKDHITIKMPGYSYAYYDDQKQIAEDILVNQRVITGPTAPLKLPKAPGNSVEIKL